MGYQSGSHERLWNPGWEDVWEFIGKEFCNTSPSMCREDICFSSTEIHNHVSGQLYLWEIPEISRNVKHWVWAGTNTKKFKTKSHRGLQAAECHEYHINLIHSVPKEATGPHSGYFPAPGCVIGTDPVCHEQDPLTVSDCARRVRRGIRTRWNCPFSTKMINCGQYCIPEGMEEISAQHKTRKKGRQDRPTGAIAA